MSSRAHGKTFWIGFLVITFLIAGAGSYLASASPDGLDAATLQGCEVIEVGGAEELAGSCIAQHAGDHAMASSPLADYAIVGKDGTGGLAGVVGVVITLAVAGGLFWVIDRRRSGS